MNSFQYYIYSSYHQLEKSDLEKAFMTLIRKINLYEKQYSMTLISYKSEWDKELKVLNDNFTEQEKNANIRYNEIYNKMEFEDDQDKHFYASHESGLDYLTANYYDDKLSIDTRYLDFFDLYSKSLLMALYSLVESKLKEICSLCTFSFNSKVKYELLSSKDYLQTSLNYLEFVLDINTESLKPFITKLKTFQLIRNKIAHNDSIFTENDENNIKEIVKSFSGALSLENLNPNHFLRIKKSSFIISFFELIRELFEELIWLIDTKQQNIILLKGLKYWFGILDTKIVIKNLQIQKLGFGRRQIEFVLVSRKKRISTFKCRIKISRYEDNTLILTDQTNNESINEFNDLVKEMKSFLFYDVFEIFNHSSKKLKLDVMIFDL